MGSLIRVDRQMRGVDAVGFYARAACRSVEIRENQKTMNSKKN